MILAWSLLSCVVEGQIGMAPVCTLVTQPQVQEWTEPFQDQVDIPCTDSYPQGRALYQAMVSEVRGHELDLLFRKSLSNPTPQAQSTYSWWLVEVESDQPWCFDARSAPAVAEGLWEDGETELRIEGLSPLGGPTELAQAPQDAPLHLVLVTGGTGLEDQRLYYQPQALVFWPSCEPG